MRQSSTHQCHGRMHGRRCTENGETVVHGKWYCKRHTIKPKQSTPKFPRAKAALMPKKVVPQLGINVDGEMCPIMPCASYFCRRHALPGGWCLLHRPFKLPDQSILIKLSEKLFGSVNETWLAHHPALDITTVLSYSHLKWDWQILSINANIATPANVLEYRDLPWKYFFLQQHPNFSLQFWIDHKDLGFNKTVLSGNVWIPELELRRNGIKPNTGSYLHAKFVCGKMAQLSVAEPQISTLLSKTRRPSPEIVTELSANPNLDMRYVVDHPNLPWDIELVTINARHTYEYYSEYSAAADRTDNTADYNIYLSTLLNNPDVNDDNVMDKIKQLIPYMKFSAININNPNLSCETLLNINHWFRKHHRHEYLRINAPCLPDIRKAILSTPVPVLARIPEKYLERKYQPGGKYVMEIAKTWAELASRQKLHVPTRAKSVSARPSTPPRRSSMAVGDDEVVVRQPPPTEAMLVGTCAATMADGKRCPRMPLPGGMYCMEHELAHAVTPTGRRSTSSSGGASPRCAYQVGDRPCRNKAVKGKKLCGRHLAILEA